MTDISIYEGALLPEVVIQFTDGMGDAVPLAETDTAAFYMRSVDFGVAAFKVNGTAMEISEADAALGIARYFWKVQDTDEPGLYYAVAEATIGGKPWREPRDGWMLVEVVPMLKAVMP